MPRKKKDNVDKPTEPAVEVAAEAAPAPAELPAPEPLDPEVVSAPTSDDLPEAPVLSEPKPSPEEISAALATNNATRSANARVRHTRMVQRFVEAGFLTGTLQAVPHPPMPLLDVHAILAEGGLADDLRHLAEIVGEEVRDHHVATFELARVGRAVITILRRASVGRAKSTINIEGVSMHEPKPAPVVKHTGKIETPKHKKNHMPKTKDPEAPPTKSPAAAEAQKRRINGSPNKVRVGKKYKPVASTRTPPRVAGSLGVLRGIPGRSASGRRGGVRPLSEYEGKLATVEEPVVDETEAVEAIVAAPEEVVEAAESGLPVINLTETGEEDEAPEVPADEAPADAEVEVAPAPKKRPTRNR